MQSESSKTGETGSTEDAAAAAVKGTAAPSLEQPAQLLAWFEANALDERGQRRMFIVPIVCRRSPEGARQAVIGSSEQALENAELAVSLDDSALGIALDDHLRQHCAEPSEPCRFWLSVHWGALMPGPSLPAEDKPVLAVRTFFSEAPEPEAPAEVYIQTSRKED
ncbi:MAG: hypothetical protein RBU37_08650 [Myxococcota bacterium]|jgi:hypothetical protein|nr:hypothetical protein [Myxococcota bacterium]